MTTQAQIHRLLRPLAENHSDVFVWKRSLVLKPVTHFVRYVLLDNTSADHGFVSRWGITECFSDTRIFHIGYTIGLNRPVGELHRINEPAAVQAVLHDIECKALPALRAMSQFDDHLAFLESPRFHLRPYGGYLDCDTALMEIAGGHVGQGRARLRKIAEAARHWRGTYMEPRIGLLVDELLPLVETDDRKGVGRLLAIWEERWIKANRLETHWRPTPFPVELG